MPAGKAAKMGTICQSRSTSRKPFSKMQRTRTDVSAICSSFVEGSKPHKRRERLVYARRMRCTAGIIGLYVSSVTLGEVEERALKRHVCFLHLERANSVRNDMPI